LEKEKKDILKKSFFKIIFFRQKLRVFNRVELFAANLRDNFRLFQKNCPKISIFPVLKSNAYGHGLSEIFKILKSEKPPFVALDSFFEALEIWKIQKYPALLIGPTMPENVSAMNFDFLAISVDTFELLRAVAATKKPIKIHLKWNSGMNRRGFEIADLPEVFAILRKNPKLKIDGIFSHFADADHFQNDFTEKQNAVFSQIVDAFFEQKIYPKWIHLGNSAGAMKTKDRRINAARVGIGLFGINPLDPRDQLFPKLKKLKPVMRVVSTILKTRDLARGEKVSYNGTFSAPRKMRVGVAPFGYFEGLDRRLSNAGFFQIGENFGKICGRVCMNLTVFEIPKTAKIGDEIGILSENPAAKNSAEKIAKMTGTIPYEVLTRISPTIRREIVF